MKFTRKQVVLAISSVVGAVAIGVGIWMLFPGWFNPYAGLVTTIDVQMDDATRTLIQQRVNTAEASIAASEKAGEKVEMNLYLTIAENEHMLGDLVASRKAYETYLKLNPVSYVAWNAYGTILETMGDLVPAGEAYQKAIEQMKSEEYYRDYAEFLAAHYPEKQAQYKQVLDDAFANVGQTTWTMVALGDWYFAQGDCAQGRDHYAVAKTLSPDNTNVAQDAEEKYAACVAK